jgi:exodeoxyribonuclease VII large subunit
VPEVIKALEILDSDPSVDVIIVARGGGDFLNLLPFSDETLVRAAAALTTPLVSAIGHEADRPLLDEVADLRASTPTDAAKRVVPDVENERGIIAQARTRLDNRLLGILDYEAERLASVRSRPSIAEPDTLIDIRSEEILQFVVRGVDLSQRLTERAVADINQLGGALRGLSPQKTLDRGYAIARLASGELLRSVKSVSPGDALTLVVGDGTIDTHVD